MRERRQEFRLSKLLRAELLQPNGHPGFHVVDLSLSGLRVISNESLPKDFAMRMYLDSEHPIEVEVRTVWQKQSDPATPHESGLRFTRVPSDVLERLMTFIRVVRNKRQAEAASLDTGSLRSLSEQELDRLTILTRVSDILNSSHDVEQVLDHFMDVLVRALHAERGFILLDRGAPTPELAASFGVDVESSEVWYSTKVVGQVLGEGVPVLSLDASVDPDFDVSQSLKLMGTRSILCVPLRSRDQKNMGLIYLDSSTRVGVFSSADLSLAGVVADLAAGAIERAVYFNTMLRNETMGALGRLVAGLSHEILNPLMAIRSAGQVLERKGADTELCRSVISEADRCTELVRDLLRMARGEQTPFTPVDTYQVLKSTVSLLKAEFRDRGAALAVDLAEGLPPVMGSAEQLRQVIINLLSNALEVLSQQKDRRALLRAHTQGSQLWIQIRDNGPGIPPEHLTQIFEPFYTTRDEGTGLGLSIVHRIVTQHGGSISAHNDPQGGAVFTIELPVFDTTLSAQRPIARDQGDSLMG